MFQIVSNATVKRPTSGCIMDIAWLEVREQHRAISIMLLMVMIMMLKSTEDDEDNDDADADSHDCDGDYDPNGDGELPDTDDDAVRTEVNNPTQPDRIGFLRGGGDSPNLP